MKNPYYKCEKRAVGCHSKCAGYAQFKVQSEELRAKRNAQTAADTIQLDLIRTRDTRIRKRLHI